MLPRAFVIISVLVTAATLASASPRKPSVMRLLRSSAFTILRGHERLAERVGALLDAAGADDLRHVNPGTAALVEDLAPGRGLGVRRREA